MSTLIAMWSEQEVQRIFDGKDKNTKVYARIGDRMKEAGCYTDTRQNWNLNYLYFVEKNIIICWKHMFE